MNKIIVGMGEALWDVLPEGKKIGGAPANFAYHVSQFGFDSRVVSAVGCDADGQEILDVFAQKKLTCEIEQVDYPTGTVQVTLDAVGVPCYEIKEGVAWDNIPFTDDLKRLALSTRAVCFGSLAQRSPVSRATIQRFLDTMPDGEDQIKIFDINLRQGFYTKEILCESMRRCNILKINDEELVTTENHPFYVMERGFLEASIVCIGDELVDSNGNIHIVNGIYRELCDKETYVYNIKVEDFHTYFVGTNEIWVHNANCTPAEKYLDRTEDNGDRVYKRKLSDGKEYEVTYTKGEDGNYYARFEDYATHPDFPKPVYPSDKGLVLNGNEKHDLSMMKSNYGKPNGYTWHHLEDGKGMLLVDSKIHEGFHHSGGASALRGN